MKENYIGICKTMKISPNSSILSSITEDPDFFSRDHLSFGHNYLGDKGAQIILSLISKNSKLQNLCLAGQGIRSDCAQALALAFQHHSCIHTIDLSSNKIGVRGANALLRLFVQNESMKILKLNNNPIPPSLLQKVEGLNEKRKESKFYINYHRCDEWLDTNIDESGSLAPIFTPSPSQTNMSFRDDFSRATNYYDPDDFISKTRSAPFY